MRVEQDATVCICAQSCVRPPACLQLLLSNAARGVDVSTCRKYIDAYRLSVHVTYVPYYACKKNCSEAKYRAVVNACR